jgi:Flp pilus assembly protein protease CpaA
VNAFSAYCSLGVLAVAAIEDFRRQKIQDILLTALAVLSLALIWSFLGLQGLRSAAYGVFAGFVFALPLLMAQIIGRNEMKLLVLAGLSAGPWAALTIGVMALIWSSLIGMVQTAVKGQIRSVFANLSRLTRLQKIQNSKLHRAPFAASLFMAALTYWVFLGGAP